MRKIVGRVIPWLMTVACLYYAFKGIDWPTLLDHAGEGKVSWVLAAIILTCLSYLLRSRRWQSLFPDHTFDFLNSARVLLLGFFMNNILPARAGEFVRAHMGARLAGQTRTLVLATIASERLVDGITISLMFVLFSVGIGDPKLGKELLYVAYFFALAGAGAVAVIVFRNLIFRAAKKVVDRLEHKASDYTFNRLQIFINGLTPLTCPKKLPAIIIFSIVIWAVELCVYMAMGRAFSADIPWPQAVLFLVAVNFASLIPAAPGGIGVIEAIASTVLVSLGISKELALTMVICQHVIQYMVVGIPGAIIMFNWKNILSQVQRESDEEERSNGQDTSHP